MDDRDVTMGVEPWLRGTHAALEAIQRQVVHALELAREDAARWCARLSKAEIHARPFDIAPVAFHLRHITRSLDRLLTYAEGRPLNATQFAALRAEHDPGAECLEILRELNDGIGAAIQRVVDFVPADYALARSVGRNRLPSTVGGLLVHCAEHTQRHIGQAITTAKVVMALRE